MKALQLVAQGRMEPGLIPDPPDPGPGEVLVRLRACGICGSDMHFYNEGGIGRYPANYPMVLGHEPAGDVVEVGAGVGHVKAGDRVAVEPAVCCGKCEGCRSGRRNLCTNCVFMGGLQVDGMLREYVVCPAENALLCPPEMSYGAITVIEPLAVLMHTMELADLRFGQSVAILGAGPIGLLGVAMSKLTGASIVVAADTVEHRREKAKQMGADAVVDPSKASVVEAVQDLTNGKGADVVLDCAAKPASINAALESVAWGGTIVLVGIPSEKHLPTEFWWGISNEATIKIQKRNNGNDHDALALLKRKQFDPETILSHHIPLEDGDKGFKLMSSYEDGIIKPLITI